MAASYAVVSGDLTATGGATTDLTSSGFGTVTGALIFMGQANPTYNPYDNFCFSVGFWDASSQRCVSAMSQDAVATSNAARLKRATRGAIAPHYTSGSASFAEYTISNVTDGIRFTMDVDNATYGRYAVVVLFGGSSSLNVGTITPDNTIGNTVSESGLGYTPDLVFFATEATGVTTSTAHVVLSFGVAVNDGSRTQRNMMVASEDNLSTTNADRRLDTDSVFGGLWVTGIVWSAELTSFDANGFTITTRDGSPAGDTAYWLAVNLDGDSAWLGTITSPTSTGSNSITSVGFQPRCAVVCGCATSVDASNSHSIISGSASDGTNEGAIAARDEDNLSTADNSGTYAAKLINWIKETDGTDDVVATLTSFDSDGRTYNYTTVNASARLGWELLMGSAAAAGPNLLSLLGVG